MIKGVHNFGVFVEVFNGHEGLVHISELDTKRVQSTEGSFTIGQNIDVKCLGKNEKGQMRLSRRAVMLRDSTPGDAAGNATDVINPIKTPEIVAAVPVPVPEPAKKSIVSAAEDAY